MITTELNLPKEKKDEFGYTKSQNRQIEKYLTTPRYRPETTMERINRIGYEHGEKGFEKKPKHMDNKYVYSFEDIEILKNNINKAQPIKKRQPMAKGKIPVIPPNPDMVNGHSDWNTEEWLESIDPGGWANDKKVQVEENLIEKYLELLKAGELLPGTTFEMFEKNYTDFDTDLISKINKKVLEKKKKEGLPSILGISPDRI